MKSITHSLGPVAAVIGAQWGDEGKGKIVDLLAEEYQIIARAAGGANAGHTIVVDDTKHIFHLLPSGCLYPKKTIVLGSAMVNHLPTLLEEIAVLRNAGVDVVPNLHISKNAHIVMEYHKAIDGALEERRGGSIGTTLRGIGPAYADKAYRTGLRMGDLIARSDTDLQAAIEEKTPHIKKMFDVDVNVEVEMKNLQEAKALLGGCIEDTVTFLQDQIAAGKTVLIEGAQATMLDIDHGTYPYVTSSATTIMGALQGLGLPPKTVTSVIGVTKAYCTRVGGGPFETEASEEDGNRLRERGAEYGATTGRPRRCGWLSVSDLKHAARMNGYTHLNVTKLDVLDEEKEIPVFVGEKCEKITLPGWKTSTKGLTSFNDLPKNAQSYIQHIEKETGVPVAFIGTGPGREEMIVR